MNYALTSRELRLARALKGLQEDENAAMAFLKTAEFPVLADSWRNWIDSCRAKAKHEYADRVDLLIALDWLEFIHEVRDLLKSLLN